MEETWERMPINKAKATLTLIIVVLIAFAILIASSIVKIDGDEVGIVEKKLFGGSLPEGRVLAVNGVRHRFWRRAGMSNGNGSTMSPRLR
ncbi:MAG: hypothetical protein ACYSTN_00235 [Planctomycetota bacterium]|jgi:hypothetical protein